MSPEKELVVALKQVGFKFSEIYDRIEEFQRFAQLVRNETLEEAAKHCEKYAVEVAASGDASLYADKYASGGTHCAAGIRNLKS